MKILYFFLLALICSLITAGPACACTSFAVYGNKVIYGVNFDYVLVPLQFIIDTHGSVKTFHLEFKLDLPGTELFVKTAGMNSKGLFGTCQFLLPTIEDSPASGADEVYVPNFYESFAPLDSVQHIEDLLKNKRLINFPGVAHHNLFADISGKAVIVETGADRNHITKNEGKFIVMTNFPMHGLKGKSHLEVVGMGADRYKTAYEYLRENADHMDIEKGFMLLKKVINKDPGLATLCSMIFDPARREIYIALDGNFEKIWKVSLEEAKIETFSGFNSGKKLSLDSSGIAASELKR